jgi:hypothetical protein
MKVKLTKKSPGMRSAGKLPKGASPTEFNLQDNGDNTFTVLGVNDAGNTVSIEDIATLEASSDNPAAITVDPPTGMTVGIHAPTNPAPAPGATANVTLTATFTDGSIGPFSISIPGTITAGPVSGIEVKLGTPTVH